MTGRAAYFGDVQVDLVENHVAVVEMNRPPANYFDRALLGDVALALAWAAEGSARAAVLCSAGKHFCAGMNFGDRGSSPDGLYEAGLKLFEQPLPLVAAVQGRAIGGGVGLALAADFRVCDESSAFHLNFAALGLHHGFGISVTLPRVVGVQAATDLLLTARVVDAAEGHRLGLVDRVSAVGELRAQACELAAQIASGAPLAVAAMRSTLRGALAVEVAHAMSDELAKQGELADTADFREGIRAARQRRPPQFSGR